MSSVEYRSHYQYSWALVIGINEYRHAGPLAIARADAESMATVLRDELGFPVANVEVLMDAAATRANLMERFLTFGSLGPDDRLLVFFAGHGHTAESRRGPVGFLVPVDGNPGDISTLIRWDELTRNADLIPAKHILFIMDACYSGLAMQRSVGLAGRRFVTDMLQRRSVQVTSPPARRTKRFLTAMGRWAGIPSSRATCWREFEERRPTAKGCSRRRI